MVTGKMDTGWTIKTPTGHRHRCRKAPFGTKARQHFECTERVKLRNGLVVAGTKLLLLAAARSQRRVFRRTAGRLERTDIE